jgi:hypothetical protein
MLCECVCCEIEVETADRKTNTETDKRTIPRVMFLSFLSSQPDSQERPAEKTCNTKEHRRGTRRAHTPQQMTSSCQVGRSSATYPYHYNPRVSFPPFTALCLPLRGHIVVRRNTLCVSRASHNKMSAVRVVSYNVLCSHLAPADRFCHCKPNDLAAPVRLKRIMKSLDVEVAAGSVLCLQEVGREWSGELHKYFSSKGFHFIHSGYGEPYNDYMGTIQAFVIPMIPHPIRLALVH